MATCVRVELQVAAAPQCPLVDVADGATVRSVCRTPAGDDGECVVEFVADGSVRGAETVFDYGSDAVYRVTDDGARPCVCERIERMGYPVHEHRVSGGTVTLAFFVPDIDALRTVIEEFADGGPVSVRRLTRSGTGADPEFALVDRSELTDRQREVLETADRMGYFGHPGEANAGEVADALGISRSTFAEHLSAAQRKLLDAVLD